MNHLNRLFRGNKKIKLSLQAKSERRTKPKTDCTTSNRKANTEWHRRRRREPIFFPIRKPTCFYIFFGITFFFYFVCGSLFVFWLSHLLMNLVHKVDVCCNRRLNIIGMTLKKWPESSEENCRQLRPRTQLEAKKAVWRQSMSAKIHRCHPIKRMDKFGQDSIEFCIRYSVLFIVLFLCLF